MRTRIQWNDSSVVDHFIANRDVSRTLNDLRGVVVDRRKDDMWKAPCDAAIVQVHGLWTIERSASRCSRIDGGTTSLASFVVQERDSSIGRIDNYGGSMRRLSPLEPMRGRPRSSGAFRSSAGAWGDELLTIGFFESRRLRCPLGEFFVGDECPSGKLFWPLERHAQLVVCREYPLDVGVTPRRSQDFSRLCRHLTTDRRLARDTRGRLGSSHHKSRGGDRESDDDGY